MRLSNSDTPLRAGRLRSYGTTDKSYFQTELSPGDWQKKQHIVSEILVSVRAESELEVAGAEYGGTAPNFAADGEYEGYRL